MREVAVENNTSDNLDTYEGEADVWAQPDLDHHVKATKKLRQPHVESESTENKKGRKEPKRIGRTMYSATANKGVYGLIDTGREEEGCSVLLVHIPKKFKDTELNIQTGDILLAEVNLKKQDLHVQFVGRSQYFPPGRKVTSCTIGVLPHEWYILRRDNSDYS